MLTELLSFLPFDKYALYILSSYGITFVILGGLSIQSILWKNKIIKQLHNKYMREGNE